MTAPRGQTCVQLEPAPLVLDAVEREERRLAQDQLDLDAHIENIERRRAGRRPLLRNSGGAWFAPADDPWVREEAG